MADETAMQTPRREGLRPRLKRGVAATPSAMKSGSSGSGRSSPSFSQAPHSSSSDEDFVAEEASEDQSLVVREWRQVRHKIQGVTEHVGDELRSMGAELIHMKDTVGGEFRHMTDAVGDELRHMKDVVRDEIQHVKKELREYFVGHISDAPAFMRFNEFIHGGYRLQVQHYSECVHSMFHLHNETVNVWSHLVGFAVMAFLFIYSFFDLEFKSFSDGLVFSLFFVGACAMFLLSTLYHLFNCHSHEVYDHLLVCDFVGIFSMIFGSFMSALQLSFYCFSPYRMMYQGIFVLLCGGGSMVVVMPRFKGEAYHVHRLLACVLIVAAGALPLLHGAWLQGFEHSFNWVVLLSIYSGGVIFYATRFPESVFPGKFDILVRPRAFSWPRFDLTPPLVC